MEETLNILINNIYSEKAQRKGSAKEPGERARRKSPAKELSERAQRTPTAWPLTRPYLVFPVRF